jgi:hypothetical protein
MAWLLPFLKIFAVFMGFLSLIFTKALLTVCQSAC